METTDKFDKIKEEYHDAYRGLKEIIMIKHHLDCWLAEFPDIKCEDEPRWEEKKL